MGKTCNYKTTTSPEFFGRSREVYWERWKRQTEAVCLFKRGGSIHLRFEQRIMVESVIIMFGSTTSYETQTVVARSRQKAVGLHKPPGRGLCAEREEKSQFFSILLAMGSPFRKKAAASLQRQRGLQVSCIFTRVSRDTRTFFVREKLLRDPCKILRN